MKNQNVVASDTLSPASTSTRPSKKKNRLSKLISPISGSASLGPSTSDSTPTLILESSSSSAATRSPSTPGTMSSLRPGARNSSRTPPRTRSTSTASQLLMTPPVPPIPMELHELAELTQEPVDDADSEPDAPLFFDRRSRANKSSVPYPLISSRALQDHDAHDNNALAAAVGSVSLIQFQVPPSRILDIGCGTGSWILNAALEWPAARIVGLDQDPIFPDLETLEQHDDNPSSSMYSKIQFVQADFLAGLPFQDCEFDFVHVKGIAAGIPEDKWPFLFSEIHRVLRPSGVLEMIEDNLHWPLPLNHSEIGKAYEDLLSSRFINITPLSLIPGAIIMYLTNLQVIDFEDGGDSRSPMENCRSSRGRFS
ncbi:hypothetical protein BS47DRAFT_1115948 [Hydnum rufescens UP504]|uniref:Methyltransferase domain-containing protein n=1 Tax=Hydnum rufescens UP504 TaxID=1448309 RepID=A0A9P6DSD8_9AGAM|nr:hypothetical protein BS47DRAFT_1115948 [Hydnum rufescens UP504]